MSERGWSDDELKDFFETNALILFASRVRATLERLQAERDEARTHHASAQHARDHLLKTVRRIEAERDAARAEADELRAPATIHNLRTGRVVDGGDHG